MRKKPAYRDLKQKFKTLEDASVEFERLQSALRESEEQYRSLFVHSKDAILLTRPDGTILDANPAACGMFGRTLEEIRRAGRNGLVDVTDPRLQTALLERTQKSTASAELTLLRANGDTFTAEVSSTIFIDGEGRQKTSMIIHDMTKRRKAEQDYQRLFWEMLDGFALHEVICDAQGNPVDHRFLAVNPAYERMTGLKAEQIVGRTALEVLPSTEHRWIETYGRVALTGKPAFQENYSEALDKYFVVSTFQFAPNQFACILADITDRKRAEEKLLLTQEVMDRASDSIIWVDDQGNLIYVNETACTSLGYTREELLNMTLFDIDPDWDRERYNDEVKKLKRLGRMTFEARHRAKDGRIFPVEVTDNYLEYNGRFISVAFDRDITDRKRAEERLLLTQTVMDRAPDGIIWTDDQGNILYVNEATCASLGYTRDELLNMTIFDIDPDASRGERHNDEVEKLKRLGRTTFEVRHRAKDGRIFPVEVTDNYLEHKGRFVGVAFEREITDRKRAEEALRKSEQQYRELSIVDDLTRLYNSRQFYVQLKTETDRANRYMQPLTLLFLDLDDFKVFNDTYGHINGDKVLRQTGQVITRCLRETDFAYRYGGEEFTVLLPVTRKEDGIVIAERIRVELKRENFSPLPGQTLHLTVSIGLAQYQPKEKLETYVQRADQLIYKGKKEGKDRVCYEP